MLTYDCVKTFIKDVSLLADVLIQQQQRGYFYLRKNVLEMMSSNSYVKGDNFEYNLRIVCTYVLANDEHTSQFDECNDSDPMELIISKLEQSGAIKFE
jgi:hypothetical protein